MSEKPIICYNCDVLLSDVPGIYIGLCKKCYGDDIDRSIQENKELISEFLDDLRKEKTYQISKELFKKWEEKLT